MSALGARGIEVLLLATFAACSVVTLANRVWRVFKPSQGFGKEFPKEIQRAAKP